LNPLGLGGVQWTGDDRTGHPATLPEAVEVYAAHGWSVFPVGGTDGKQPLTTHGLKDASADPATVREWWRRWPRANVAWALPVGVWALDVDGDEGRASLRALEQQHGRLPTLTLRQHTGRGGEQWIWRTPAGVTVRQRVRFAAGLDTRVGGRGYVVVPPSVTRERYRWIATVAPVEAPPWLTELVREKSKPQSAPYTPPATPDPAVAADRRGYARELVDRLARKVAATAEGSRNVTLFGAWRDAAAFRDVLDKSEVRATLRDAARHSGLDDREIDKVLR
jgi:bifunctional DNA primase/polymerase-like protein